ncbi:MAG TPA: cytochrome c nitrite reductase small subunit [Anaerolineae bacterium]|nr:cytochrome c nitrite reductase small subunit [Anaerolineae bacterium]
MSTTTPPPSGRSRLVGWVVAAVAAVGVLVGLSVFTFVYAQGGSYLSDDPAACKNCHIMREQFDAWNRSSHTGVATCNDCHTPHTSALAKWAVKGLNGFNHSLAFTTGAFPEPIRIKPLNAAVAQENCVACHATMVSQIHGAQPGEERSCVSCHSNPGHGR